MDVLKHRGRTVTDADVVFIRQLIAAHPRASRRALSKKLCEAWNWVQPNGVPRDMVCRGLMLALHRAGHIELPPVRWVSEKTRDVLKTTGDDAEAPGGPEIATEDGAASTQDSDQAKEQEAVKRKGHGRNGADAYRGAEKIRVPHESLRPGDSCPDCKKGKVYEVAQPGVLVRIVGQAPVQAKVYELQKLRCNLCGKAFTAREPEGVNSEKYNATAASMIALLKYGSGLPLNRTFRPDSDVTSCVFLD